MHRVIVVGHAEIRLQVEKGRLCSLGEISVGGVRQPARDAGRRAAEKLIRVIENGSDEHREVRLPTQLVVRSSCAKADGR